MAPEDVADAIDDTIAVLMITQVDYRTGRKHDMDALTAKAHAAGALLVVDNTFASPYLQQPLLLGADVVVHSTTKYLGGHSDVIGGALIARDPELASQLAYHQNAMGAVAGPFDSWLALRGAKTLAVRMDRHCANAKAIVDVLREVADPRLRMRDASSAVLPSTRPAA